MIAGLRYGRGRARASGGRSLPRAAVPRIALIAALFVVSIPRASLADDADFKIDEATGHPFRVRFNPARRFFVGLGAAAQPLSDDPATPTLEATIGVNFRSLHSDGAGAGLIVWQVESDVASGYVWPFRRSVAGAPALDASIYRVSLHRHDESPSAVLPFTPPVSVPFPFDIGFEGEVGRFFVPGALPQGSAASGSGSVQTLRASVLRASIFLDPWRSLLPGRSLEFGVGARYDIDPIATSPSSGLRDAHILHRIAPMTAASLRFRFQSEDGLTVLDLRGDFIPHWTSEQVWKTMAFGSGRFERTLFAINDEPFALVIEGDYRRTPESQLLKAQDDLRVSLGLQYNVQIP